MMLGVAWIFGWIKSIDNSYCNTVILPRWTNYKFIINLLVQVMIPLANNSAQIKFNYINKPLAQLNSSSPKIQFQSPPNPN